jgi:hypothetical protein
VLKAVVGGTATAMATVSLAPPAITVTVDECAAQKSPACQLEAAVGFATVEVTLPGNAATTGVLTSTVNGAAQGTSIPLSLAPAPTTGVPSIAGRALVPVPATPPGEWILQVQVGTSVGKSDAISLKAPPIVLSLSGCDGNAPCTARVGSVVSATVTAPAQIGQAQATVRVHIGNVASPPVFLTLDETDLAAGTITGELSLTVPSQPGAQMQIDATVAGFRSNSVVATIAP